MPTMEELDAETTEQPTITVDYYGRRRLAVEWIAANPGKHTPELPRDMAQGFRDAAHAREITYSAKGGWVLAPEHVDEPEAEDESEEEDDAESDDTEE